MVNKYSLKMDEYSRDVDFELEITTNNWNFLKFAEYYLSKMKEEYDKEVENEGDICFRNELAIGNENPQ